MYCFLRFNYSIPALVPIFLYSSPVPAFRKNGQWAPKRPDPMEKSPKSGTQADPFKDPALVELLMGFSISSFLGRYKITVITSVVDPEPKFFAGSGIINF